MNMDDLYNTEYEQNLQTWYTKLWGYICDGKERMLEPVWLKIDEKQQFYSKTDKKPMTLGPTWKMYLVSNLKDDEGRVMVYAPYTFSQGKIFLIPDELVIRLGYN